MESTTATTAQPPATQPSIAPVAAPAAQIPAQPAQQPVVQTPEAVEAQRQPLIASLNDAEAHWMWKFGLRTLLVISNIIGIGCITWAVSVTRGNGSDYFMDNWALPWSLVTFVFSCVWCFNIMAVLLVRRKTVHPGALVGVDLILWLGFIGTGLLALSAMFGALHFGDDGYIWAWRSGSDGDFYLSDNGTWYWNSTHDSSYYNYYGYSNPPRDCTPQFASCEAMDASLNHLWKLKPRLVATEVIGAACQWLSLLFHLILFIWACVDTHRHNSSKVTKQAKIIAEHIIRDMAQRGQIVPMQNMTQPLLAPLPRGGSSSTVGQQEPPQMGGQPVYAMPPMAMMQQPFAPVPPMTQAPRNQTSQLIPRMIPMPLVPAAASVAASDRSVSPVSSTQQPIQPTQPVQPPKPTASGRVSPDPDAIEPAPRPNYVY